VQSQTPAALGRLKERQRENGVKQRKNAHGSIAGLTCLRDQRRTSRVSKRNAGYQEHASDAGRELPSEPSEGFPVPGAK